jgi:AGCS family alanine or glycine:cation symporter
MSIDQQINDFFKPFSDKAFEILLYSVEIAPGIDVKLILAWLIAASLYFTFYLGFINVRYFKHAIDVVRRKYDKDTDEGQIDSWEALMTSMSGTVGLGNIAGVAVAVSVGGPGAVFWMIVMGFLSMSLKFAEVTMGMKYRHPGTAENPDALAGGPMYYIKAAFEKYKMPFVGSFLAALFAVCCLAGGTGGGNMFQANQVFQQLYHVTGGEAGIMAGKGWLFGILLAALVGVVIIGGIKKIATVSSRLVPAMAIIYVGACLTVILMNYAAVPAAFVEIITGALTPAAGFGGIIGSLMVGVQRAAFSNESGLGSAAIVYSAARTHHPVTQGMASMLGPFIDTIVICTMTALLIVVSGVYETGQEMAGVELTSKALESGISWFPYVLALSVFLFAYSTLITWFYYSLKCLTYLFGEKEWIATSYKIFYCLCVVIGCSAELSSLIDFTDALFLSMAVPNIIGLYMLAPEIKRELKDYLSKVQL